MTPVLFEKGPTEPPSPAEVAQSLAGTPRLRVPHRQQVEMHWASLDELLEADHRVRLVWAAVAGLRLDRWLNSIKAVEGNVGRNTTDPRLLVALWVYAILDGVGSARELARLCEKHLAYQWLCGGVSVNYHLLASFRSQGGDKWEDLMTQIVGSLLSEGLVTLNRVAQDGMRVRAHAGKDTFRRRGRLESCLAEARQQVEALKQLAEEALVDGGFASREAIEKASQAGCTVYAPLKEEKKQLAAGKNPYAKKKGDSPALEAWRARMGTDAAKTVYRLRCQTAEWANAMARNRGLWQMPLRGRKKCRTVAVIYAIAHNLMQALRLRAAVTIPTQ